MHSIHSTEMIFTNQDLFFEFLRFFKSNPYFGTYVTLALAYKTEIVSIINIMNRIIDEINNGNNFMGNLIIEINKLIQNPSMKKLHMSFELKIFR